MQGQGVGEQIGSAAVDGLLGDDVLPFPSQRLDGVGDGSRTGCQRQAGDAAFQGCDAVFEHALRGIGQAAVDVARIRQAEAIGSMLGIMEHIGSGGVNGYRAGVGREVGLFLAYVKLKGFEPVLVGHDIHLL